MASTIPGSWSRDDKRLSGSDPDDVPRSEATGMELRDVSRDWLLRERRQPSPPVDEFDGVECVPLTDERWELQHTLKSYNKNSAAIKQRTLGVAFRDLRVIGAGSEAALQDTFGSLLNPLVIADKVRNAISPQNRNIISGFEGVVRPGEMLLVLGRPGSGCSTLLKVLSNQRAEYKAVEGTVHYDSLSPATVEKHYRGDVLYVQEDDIHFPSLRVGETFEFAATTRTPERRPYDWSREQMVHEVSELAMTVFGLKHTAETYVGDAIIRGISGGEKKRVSIAEAMMARAKLTAFDNTTRGLDSSTALEFANALRNATDSFKYTTVASLYQASENLYSLFDKACVIYEGRMAYFGPASQARQYFIDLGYEPANRQTTPDFLVSVTDPLSRIPRADILTAPRSAEEFAAAFKQSNLGERNQRDISEYEATRVGQQELALAYKESAQEEHASGALKTSPYLLSIPMQIKAVMKRRVRVMRGQLLFHAINTFVFLIMGVIMGTLFWNLPNTTNSFYSRASIIFFALLFPAVSTLSEVPAMYAQRPIVHRHMRAAQYHPLIEAVALTLVDVPITFVATTVFGVVVYFFSGLARTAEQFFIFLLFMFIMSLSMKAFFRAITAMFKSQPIGQAVSGIAIMVILMFTGFTVPRPSLVEGLKWVLWINPMFYGLDALLSNEMSTISATCSNLIPSGPGYEAVGIANQVCATVGAQPGQNVVEGPEYLWLSYAYRHDNLWRNFGVVTAFTIGFLAVFLYFSEINTEVALSTAITRFRRGSKLRKLASTTDAETGVQSPNPTVTPDASGPASTTEATLQSTNVFSWRNVQYTVKISKDENRRLLDDISGYVAPGKLTALMGESGAGKTTLLNVLAQRVTSGEVVGEMLVDGYPLPRDFQAQTGYCQQLDTHVPLSTVREALLFSAKLRQPSDVPLAEKEAYVDQCLKMCGLEEYADAIVGTLSTEIRKRTTIGVELAAKPKLLLFLDEPTSGLDSQSAWAIMMVLRSLAERGAAILCTIHQPSAELFQVFDRVLLLQKGGKTTYFGDLGQHSTKLIHFFEGNGARKCEAAENPAEYMLDVIGAGATAQATRDWPTIWSQSVERERVSKEIDAFHSAGANKPVVEELLSSDFATSWITQVKENTLRLSVQYWRDTPYVVAKLALSILGSLLVGFTFFQTGDSQQGTQNKVFSVWMAITLAIPHGYLMQLPWLAMRDVYEVRERPSRMYSWSALVTAQVLVEIPLNIVVSALIFCCWYWTSGYDTARAGFMALILILSFPLYFQTLAQSLAAVAPSIEIAGILFSFLFNFAVLFNGVIQPFSQMGWWRWMYRVSPFTYLLEALIGYGLGRQEVHCSPVEFLTINPPAGQTCGDYLSPYMTVRGGYVQDLNATSACRLCPAGTTDQMLGGVYNLFYENHWRDFGIMMAFVVFNTACIFAFTYLRVRRK